MFTIILYFVTTFYFGNCQIDLGSFNLNKNPLGQWDLGFSQAANILGFGGDRGFKLQGGNGGLGLQTNQGALIGGERVGVDSGLGVNQNTGLGLGSMLSFGNQPSQAPGGQLEQFLQIIGRFFQGVRPPPSQPPPSGPPGGEPFGRIGVPIVPSAPNMPQQPDLGEPDFDEENGREGTTFPTLLKNGKSEENEKRKEEIDFSIDDYPESTTMETMRQKFQTKNPRMLPGLEDMGK